MTHEQLVQTRTGAQERTMNQLAAFSTAIVVMLSFAPAVRADGSTWTMPYTGSCNNDYGYCIDVKNNSTHAEGGIHVSTSFSYALHGVALDSASGGVLGESLLAGGVGVLGLEFGAGGIGVLGLGGEIAVKGDAGRSGATALAGSGGHTGVAASGSSYGVNADGGTSGIGVYGLTGSSQGVYGQADTGVGVFGISNTSQGVYGYSGSGFGVYGFSSVTAIAGITTGEGEIGASGVYGYNDSSTTDGTGITGRVARSTSYAVYGDNTAGGIAGYFHGDVTVTGSLSKGSGSFLIDHPLDPENRVLRHSFVESPDMKNVYDGIITLDKNGEGWVTLPDYFGALNRDFRYQLTNIGAFAQTYVAQEIENNRFKIAGGKPGMKVSWQVTGTRQDAFAEDHRIVVEEMKAPHDRGRFYYSRAPGAQRIGWLSEEGSNVCMAPSVTKTVTASR